MKGHNNSYHVGINTIRGRQLYVIMLILAFGAAVMGLMLLHKIRERRVYSLLVKEKDHQLISLHLLLQKERDHTKEAKRKIQELKAKIYSVRMQKMELDGKLSEMQSVVSSLKEEQKTLETSLEEKQNEIKLLRAKETEPHIENAQRDSSMNEKESENGELKHHLDNPPKIWSVSTDDPSNLTMISTNNFQNQVQGDEDVTERNDDEVERKETEGLTLDEVKSNPTSNETDAKIANQEAITTKGEIEDLSLHGNVESRQIEMKPSRLRARQQRRGAHVIRHRRFRMTGQPYGRYKKIIDKELEKLGMHEGEVQTGRKKIVNHEFGQENEMRKTEIGDDKNVENRLESDFTQASAGEIPRNNTTQVLRDLKVEDENGNKSDEPELSEKNVNNDVQIRSEMSNNDESVDLSSKEDKITQRNEEAETVGDYEEVKAERDESKAGSIEETDESDF